MARCVRKQDPRPAFSGAVFRLSHLAHLPLVFLISERVECSDAVFTSRPPILYPPSGGPWIGSPEKMGQGGKMCVEAGPASGALGSRDDCVLPSSFLDKSILFDRRVYV